MSQIGTEKEAGVSRDTAVYEISDIDPGIYRVQTPSGIGVIPLCDTDNRYSTGDRIQTQKGLKAIWSMYEWPVLRLENPPKGQSAGIGGNTNVIWLSDSTDDPGFMYELSTSDFSVISSGDCPDDNPRGTGGDENTIWHCAEYPDEIYELSASDFSTLRTTDAIADYPRGIGGNGSVIWHCDPGKKKVYELSTSDFSVVRSGDTPGLGSGGIGGNENTIWYCESNSKKAYELSITDFSVIRSGSTYGSGPTGIGGDGGTIWHCNDEVGSGNDKICELATNWYERCV